jgi:hypothetical protein
VNSQKLTHASGKSRSSTSSPPPFPACSCPYQPISLSFASLNLFSHATYFPFKALFPCF